MRSQKIYFCPASNCAFRLFSMRQLSARARCYSGVIFTWKQIAFEGYFSYDCSVKPVYGAQYPPLTSHEDSRNGVLRSEEAIAVSNAAQLGSKFKKYEDRSA